MLKNCVVLKNLSSIIIRAMSKKCKIELAKKSSIFTESASATDPHDNFILNSNSSEKQSDVKGNNILRFSSPVKSANDKKDYSVIRLENGLTALLVSDEASTHDIKILDSDSEISDASDSESSDAESCTSKASVESQASRTERGPPKKDEKLAACSLTVGVGSFSDPDDIPGLAHFLEHMVFMGSEKFPKENEFDSFIKKHGGSDNASTECEFTTFYFECQDKYMPKAMDIFSQFFISPLMKREAMTREREAVESEFTIALPSDVFRRQQLLASTAVPGNPGGKFLWGNLKTLRDDVTDDHLYESVHKFWQRHYSAHRMTLAVQARVSLDTLEKWVVKYFSNIPCNNMPPPNYMSPLTPFQKEKFNKIYFVESVDDNILLELNWHLPPVKHLYKSKPTNYLSWTIGHEGKGSLISFLRKKLWALGLTAGHNEDGLANNSIYSLFTVSIFLTENGVKNLNEVLNAIFSYIRMLQLKGPEERIFTELQKIADIDFRYDEEAPAVQNVEFLSDNMQIYPPTHYITGNELLFEYNPNAIQTFLNSLSPSSVNIILSKKHHDPSINLDKVEPWFKTVYTSQDIPESWSDHWNNIRPYKEFNVPEPNKFITSDFTILHQGEDGPAYPEKILSSDTLSIWYKPDLKFKLPLGFISFQIINKTAFESILDNTILSMYTEILNHLLVEELYPANMALLEYCITVNERAVLIEVYGFNEKLHILLEKIAEYILKFNEYINEDLLNAFKETNTKGYFNNNLKIINLSKEVRLSILLNSFFTSADKYNILPNVSLELIKKFSKEFFNKVHIQCLVQGNIRKEQALSICKNFVNQLNTTGLSVQDRPKFLVHKLPNSEKCCRIQSFNTSDSNCMTTNYYQLGIGGVRDYCLIDLLMMLIEEPLFDQLRTQEQLGYDVNCSIREMYGVLGFTVTVVSQIHKHSVAHVEQRITNFLVTFLETLKKMPLSEFNEVVQSLINLKQCCDLHIKEEIKRNWAEIKCFEYAFDRLERETKMLATLKPEDVITFLETRISPTNPEFRKLTVQIVGHHSKMEDNEIIQEEKESNLPTNLTYSYLNDENIKDNYFIKNIKEFKSQLSIYPESKVFQC